MITFSIILLGGILVIIFLFVLQEFVKFLGIKFSEGIFLGIKQELFKGVENGKKEKKRD